MKLVITDFVISNRQEQSKKLYNWLKVDRQILRNRPRKETQCSINILVLDEVLLRSYKFPKCLHDCMTNFSFLFYEYHFYLLLFRGSGLNFILQSNV